MPKITIFLVPLSYDAFAWNVPYEYSDVFFRNVLNQYKLTRVKNTRPFQWVQPVQGVKAHSHQARLRPSTRVYVRRATCVDETRVVYVRRRAWFGHAFHFAWIVIRSRRLIKMASDSDSDVDEILIFAYFHTHRRTLRHEWRGYGVACFLFIIFLRSYCQNNWSQ